MSRRQKKETLGSSTSTELSTNKLAPGILKVFGDHVLQGSHYKAIRASSISTALEVVRVALEKYGLEQCNPKEYVLCDVVGHFVSHESIENDKTSKRHKSRRNFKSSSDLSNQSMWRTIYVRAINENEKPLVLQSLWKPANGRFRRFELRKKIEVETSCFFINTADSIERRASEISFFGGSDYSAEVVSCDSNSISSPARPFSSPELSLHSRNNFPSSYQGNDEGFAPYYEPYLLLIKGCSVADKLVQKLHDQEITVGPYRQKEKNQYEIVLYSADIVSPVCKVYKKLSLDGSTETNIDDSNFLIYIEPLDGADITIDGSSVVSSRLLKPGQLITFGASYLYIFKDPTQIKDADLSLSWLEGIRNLCKSLSAGVIDSSKDCLSNAKNNDWKIAMEDKAIQVEPEFVSSNQVDSDVETDISSDGIESVNSSGEKRVESKKYIKRNTLQLSYDLKEEDELLHTIIDIADEELGEFKLIPAYFFLMVIEHSAVTFSEVQTRKLLLKISSGMQGIAWEKTKEIGKQYPVRDDSPLFFLQTVLKGLKLVLFWMTNALEMLHFLQCNLKKYLSPWDQVNTSEESLLSADEELLSVLEEVIMFTFQQTIYHLTKVLYVALPAILESNPFQVSNGDYTTEEEKNTLHISSVIQIFTEIFDTFVNLYIHPQIISQFFAYLFFFTNAYLFNSLMEKGPASKIFRWTKGVQIRGNLDVLEEWTVSNGLNSEFDRYMKTLVAAVDLLSTPKAQLMQCEWQSMREDYADLNPAQLQVLLGEYELNGAQKPRGWYPSTEEVELALRTTDILESFGTHPPLILPSTEFKVNLNESPCSEEFSRYLREINEKFNSSDTIGRHVTSENPVMNTDSVKS